MKKLACIVVAGLATWQGAGAAELAEGTVIEKANLDAVLGDTFQGKALDALVPEAMRLLIRDYALKLTLAPITPYQVDPLYHQVTEKFSPNVEYDPHTKNLRNYVAGVPFPKIDAADPHAGIKVVWNNFYYLAMSGPAFDGVYDNLLVDAAKGLEHHQIWRFSAIPLVGRTIEPHVFGDGSVAKKELVVARQPYDIRGLGVFTIRYADGRPDDRYAYVKSIRRVRRISSGTWVDPVGGSDYLYDDINGFNAHPSWYEQFNYIERKHILGFQTDVPQKIDGAGSAQEMFPHIDLGTWPHWNPVQKWGPVEVDVVEAIPPSYHPYGKKTYYYSTALPGYILMMEAYDKRDQLWKVDLLAPGVNTDDEGRQWVARFLAHMIDVQFQHATIAVGWNGKPKHLDPKDMEPQTLAIEAR
jgi:hypothetical protein